MPPILNRVKEYNASYFLKNHYSFLRDIKCDIENANLKIPRKNIAFLFIQEEVLLIIDDNSLVNEENDICFELVNFMIAYHKKGVKTLSELVHWKSSAKILAISTFPVDLTEIYRTANFENTSE